MQIVPSNLIDIVQTLKLIGIDVIGSKESDQAVWLIIQGDIVPDAPQVRFVWSSSIGTIHAQITVHFEIVA